MKIKYSPCEWNEHAKHNFSIKTKTDTDIQVISENEILIDGESFVFALEDVLWEDLAVQTEGKIYSAFRTDGELYITLRRFYTSGHEAWDTGEYHEVNR